MKYFKIVTSFLLFTLLFGCDKIDELTQFTIVYNEEVVIESSTVIDLPFNAFTPEISSNTESKFENNNTAKDLIEYIELTKMTLNIDSPDHGNFDFLNAIEIYISAENEEEVLIAWKDIIHEDGSTVIELDTSNDDLQNYLKKDEFSLRLATVTDQIITSDHKINVRSEFFVDARLLGL
ncbi:hypothetical protein Q4566_12590 [Tamlana sp. 2_MG-2023]|uniref:hypothetical protein n=1 Tax=unclassified Tamlana TaxID=2614803 RepID=UPI0026E1D7E1|nr:MULTISPECIES: hypothetical protein [unclassified Tamlana]MDO6761042.1 hypothetical protein [Tamlana sp. 2_MG-2023]MDO6791625.1 hypothetical protein [Tamlana sp. 1_MG-2023]